MRAAGLVGTVEGLRAGLRSRGSDLVVLRGPLEERLPELAAAVGAARIVTEDEVEFRRAPSVYASSQLQGFGRENCQSVARRMLPSTSSSPGTLSNPACFQLHRLALAAKL